MLEIERRRTPVALPFVNGTAERAIKSVRLEMLNHVRVRDVEERQWNKGDAVLPFPPPG